MQRLLTADGENLPRIPWQSYPRPQMRRDRWLCLNGEWEVSWNGTATKKIIVPFCLESLLSGTLYPPEPGTQVEYSRMFEIPETWKNSRILLHFGAVSQKCIIAVNHREVIRHENAYLPFYADITEYLQPGRNLLHLITVNDLSSVALRGKQSKKRGGMWYTPVSGIWQTVWIEPVPQKWIQALTIETLENSARIQVSGISEGYLLFEGHQIPLENGNAVITPEDPVLWSPETPKLYPFAVISGEDRVESYFALRTLEVKTINGVRRLCLNGRPYFFHGVLDQGYWSDGLYTPASPVAYERDIRSMKSLGFNTLRKHIKIEPEQFYYDCDRLGMIVFQDMVNNGKYHYLRETVLPTLGIARRSDHHLNKDPESRRAFLEGMRATVQHLRNHPSICLWTIFNEGWGQFCADDAYRILKSIDRSRFVDSTSGWFRQNLSDVYSAHIYFRKLRIKTGKQPQLISEYGGYSYKIPKHSFNLKKTYGYKMFSDRVQFADSLRNLFAEVFKLKEEGLSGAIYTQLSDVEDETNGLLTFDRKVQKIDPENLRQIETIGYERK